MVDLAPPDAIAADADRPMGQRCINCDCFSVKVFGGADDQAGKCFRGYAPITRTVYWIDDGNRWCPGWRLEVLHG